MIFNYVLMIFLKVIDICCDVSTFVFYFIYLCLLLFLLDLFGYRFANLIFSKNHLCFLEYTLCFFFFFISLSMTFCCDLNYFPLGAAFGFGSSLSKVLSCIIKLFDVSVTFFRWRIGF